MRGRKPKPTSLHDIDGTRNATKHRDRATEAKPTTALHLPPADLAADELAEWQHIMDNAPAGLLKQLDRAVLLNYVRAVVAQGNAWREMQAGGLTVMSAGGVETEAPAVRTFQKMSLLMLRCAEQLGFSPSSRPRVHVDAEAEKTNPFAAFGAARRAKVPAAEKPGRKVH